MASAQHTERIGIGHAEIAEQVLLAALLRLFDEDASCAPLARVHGLASGHSIRRNGAPAPRARRWATP
ncbi:hypothetical protein, partial [Pseudomonas paraeruginosa]|uniref:hypothetical protein n=1 Tax=Pseudomonas paraeruginosa TaxID=2994495 RepID=UPI003FCF16A5